MKTKLTLILMLLPAAIALYGCGDDSDNGAPASLELGGETLELKNDGVPVTITIESNTSWNIAGIPDWLTVAPTAGAGNADIRMTAAVNYSDAARPARLTFTVDGGELVRSLDVNQNPVFSLNKARVEFAPGTTEETLEVKSEISWLARVPDDAWFELSVDEGTGDATIEVGLGSNATVFEDSEITFVFGDGERTVEVSRKNERYGHLQAFVYEHSTKANPSILVFTGDGFTEEDHANGYFYSAMAEAAEGYFQVEPYASHREYFTTIFLPAYSPESGIRIAGSDEKNTFWQTYYPNHMQHPMMDDSMLIIQTMYEALYDSFAEDPDMFWKVTNIPFTSSIVMNIDWGGGLNEGYLNGYSVGIFGYDQSLEPHDRRDYFAFLVQHESGGHGYVGFADEYISYNDQAPQEYIDHVNQMHDYGININVSPYSDIERTPWYFLSQLPAYANTVGMYEGGLHYSRGIWRSEPMSIMSGELWPYHHSAICRYAIIKRIYEYAGERFSLDIFLEKDVIPDQTRTTRSVVDRPFRGLNHPPVFHPEPFIPRVPDR